MDGSEEFVGRTMVQVITEKYNLENFPYCRGPGTGVVVLTSPQSSPVKGNSLHFLSQHCPDRLSKQHSKTGFNWIQGKVYEQFQGPCTDH